MFSESSISALVMRDGLLEAILAMENVAYIVFEDANAPGLAESGEDFASALGGCEGTVVFAQKNQRLDGTVQRAGRLLLISQCFIDLYGLLMMLDCGTVLAASV